MVPQFGIAQLVNITPLLIGGLDHVLFSPVVGMMIQSDELIFFRGVGIPPARLTMVYGRYIYTFYGL